MRSYYQILWPLLSLFLVRVDLTDLIPLRIPVKVLKVFDGDTVLVGKGSYEWRLRLAKVDAPEKGQPALKMNIDIGDYSKKCLQNILRKQKSFEMSLHKFDMYGRALGDINEVTSSLVQEGCVSLYPYAEFKNKFEKSRYLQLLRRSQKKRLGIWKWGGMRQPTLYRKFKKRFARRQ